jgi:hypothetical protein
MRMFKLILTAAVFTALFSCATTDSLGNSEAVVSLNLVSTYDTGVFDESAAEIVTFDAASGRVFFVNANDSAVQIIENTTLVGEVTFGDGAANSVVSKNGIIAVAVEADNKQAPGKLYFIDVDGNKLNSVTVGSLPDMVTITGDGKYALVANEGEPSSDYSVDPEGTVSIVDLSKGVENLTDADVTTVQFMESQVKGAPVRHTGPAGTTFGQDMEPEYIADSGDAFEQTILKMYPDTFNASNDNLAADDRSDDKGPEPEAVAIGEVDGAIYAFIGAERFGGIFVYNVSNPKVPVFVEYVLTRNMKAAVNEDLEYDDTSYANTGDLGLEGFAFVPASQSTTGSAMLIVGNEVSGTVNIFEVK